MNYKYHTNLRIQKSEYKMISYPPPLSREVIYACPKAGARAGMNLGLRACAPLLSKAAVSMAGRGVLSMNAP